MNDKTVSHQGVRRAGALAVAAAVAVLATACAGSALSSASTPSSGSAPAYAQELALAQCMRSHGVPNFPDPLASGGYTLTTNGSVEGAGGSSIAIDSSQAQAAYGDCRHLLAGAPSISQLEQDVRQAQQRQEQALPALLKFSQCMRSHGVPDFPDFGQPGQSPPAGNKASVNPDSPQFRAALSACHDLLPPGAHISIHVNVSVP